VSFKPKDSIVEGIWSRQMPICVALYLLIDIESYIWINVFLKSTRSFLLIFLCLWCSSRSRSMIQVGTVPQSWKGCSCAFVDWTRLCRHIFHNGQCICLSQSWPSWGRPVYYKLVQGAKFDARWALIFWQRTGPFCTVPNGRQNARLIEVCKISSIWHRCSVCARQGWFGVPRSGWDCLRNSVSGSDNFIRAVHNVYARWEDPKISGKMPVHFCHFMCKGSGSNNPDFFYGRTFYSMPEISDFQRTNSEFAKSWAKKPRKNHFRIRTLIFPSVQFIQQRALSPAQYIL
jgi:hypothetical protein